MAQLTMTLIYDDKPPIQAKGARRTLRAANAVLRLLRACEREITSKPPKIVWEVNIYSLDDRAVIEFATHVDAKEVAERALLGIQELRGGAE